MTVIVSVPGQAEGWQVSNHAFGLLAERLRSEGLSPELLHFLDKSQALQLLDLSELPGDLMPLMIEAIRVSARDLRSRLLAQPGADAWSIEFADALAILEMWMDGLTSN